MLTGHPVDRRKAPRISTNGKLPGVLVMQGTGEEIACLSIDVSKIGVGITCEVDIPLQTKLFLVAPDLKVLFSVVSNYQPQDTQNNRRLGLLLEDSNVDLESMFRKFNCISEIKEPLRAQALRMAPRFVPSQEITLEMRTFGTQNPYNFFVENVSHSGLLVATTIDETLPFRVNTLVDMVIDLECRAFKSPILATGKIVRRFEDEPRGSRLAKDSRPLIRIGLAIVDIDPRQQDDWTGAMEALEQMVHR